MKSILIVDDEKIIASAIQRSLGKLAKESGIAITVLNNGIDAIQFLQNQTTPISLAILDLLMPELNGSDILDWIHKNSSATKVIMMTAYGDPSTKEDLIKRGAQMVLQKPFDDIYVFPKLAKEILE